jgi:hypothetical protein
MFWWILLALFGLFVFALIVIAVSPFHFSSDASIKSGHATFNFLFYWLHPALLKVRYAHDEKNVETIIFSRFKFMQKAGEEAPAEGRQKGGSAAERQKPPEEKPSDMPETEAADAEPAEKPAGQDSEETPGKHMPRGEDSAEKPHTPDAKSENEASPQAREPEAGTDEKKQEKPSAGEPRKSIRQQLRENKYVFVLRQKRLRNKALSCAGNVARSTLGVISFERFQLRLRSGTDNPIAPGMAYGYFIAVRNALALHQRKDITLEFEPVFSKEDVLECEGALGVKTTIARAMYPLLVLLVTFPYLSAFVTWRRMKKKGML